MRETNAERGFTLIELMVVVAIVAILAAVAIPAFTKDAQKTRGKTEVAAMFAQLQTKEETYKQESGSYLAAAKCPSNPTAAGYNFTTSCATTGSAWESLRVVPPETTMRCAYTIVVGATGTTFTPPTGFKNSQSVVNGTESNLAGSWWYMTADCDEDASGATSTNAKYYASSVDPTIQVQNSGS